MITIPARDGSPIAARVYDSTDPAPRAVALVQAGTAIPQSFYRHFAAHLAGQGIAVVTFDYRGIGDSKPERLADLDVTMEEWATDDASAALAWVRERYPGTPLFVVGHSFGAQAIGLMDELGDVDGFVSVAGQLGWYGHWPLPTRLELGLLWHLVIPATTRALGRHPGAAGLGGVDLPAGVARQWASWCRSRHYYLDHVPQARERLRRFDRPMLMWSFTDDDFAPIGAVRAFERSLKLAPLTHVRVAPADVRLERIGHFGFFREPMQPAWDRVVEFVDSVIERRFVARRPALVPTEADVMADLAFGRA